MGKDPDQIRREIEDTRDRMGDTVDALAYKADVPSRVKDNINERVDGVKSALSNTVSRVSSAVTGTTARLGNTVGGALPDASDVRDGTKATVGMLKENPLGLLLCGVAAGFLLGSLFPATDLENDRLGNLSDSLKEQAKDAGSHVLEHGKAVLRETAQAAKESVQDHGAQIAGQARDQFEDLKNAAADGYAGTGSGTMGGTMGRTTNYDTE